MTGPWRKYAVKKHADGKPASGYGCQKLTWVFHVTHIPIALRILEDGRIRSDLVYDESRLNQTRTRVVWVSPNRWNNKGFRYGNVEFPMAWNQLWSGVKAYWVEVVEKYNPHACRILLSDQPHDDLERYDPSSGEGPWWVSPSGEHYWNGDHTLELLLERDIQLSPESICQFTKHHPIYCTINSKTCKYMNRDLQTAGDEFISGLVARRLRVKVDGQKQRPADKMFIQSANRLILNGTSRFKADVSANRLTSDMPSSCSVARALITAWFYRDAEDAKSLVIQFASAEDLRKALSAVIAWTLRLEDMTWLDEQASSG